MAAGAFWYLLAAWQVVASELPAQNPEDNRGRQLVYYAPRHAPRAQRLVSTLDSNAEAQFYQPNQPKQDVQTFSLPGEDRGRGEKLETLEPDAELLPEAQQPRNPPAQVPLTPPAGIPRLLPGQQVYIVNPQHQVYMNALYPGLTNGFRPNVQIPGYQRFFIVPQATAGGGSLVGPAGYQNTIYVNPSGQPVEPQYFQPAYQRFVAPSPSTAENPAPDKAESTNQSINNAAQGEPIRDSNKEAIIRNPEPTRASALAHLEPNRIGENVRVNYLGGYQQTGNYLDAQPQFGYSAQQNAYPFFDFSRQPFYQGQRGDFQNNLNRIQYAQGENKGQFPAGPYQGGQLLAGQFPSGLYPSGQFPIAQFPVGQLQPGQLQPGQFHQGQFDQGQVGPGQFGPGQFGPGQDGPGQLQAGQYPEAALNASPIPVSQVTQQEAQGRNDYNYENIRDDASTEANNKVEETSSKAGYKVEPAPEQTKENIETASTTESVEDDKETVL